jgi:ribonuclease HI
MTTSNTKTITIYTDGACKGNPGKGGWGAILIFGENQKKINGFNPSTTNNQMELTAVIEALKAVKNPSYNINLFTDSKYVMDGITSWIFNWKKNGWKSANKQPVKNKELWIELDTLCQNFKISWNWVKGHSGDKYNDLVDELANAAIK